MLELLQPRQRRPAREEMENRAAQGRIRGFFLASICLCAVGINLFISGWVAHAVSQNQVDAGETYTRALAVAGKDSREAADADENAEESTDTSAAAALPPPSGGAKTFAARQVAAEVDHHGLSSLVPESSAAGVAPGAGPATEGTTRGPSQVVATAASGTVSFVQQGRATNLGSTSIETDFSEGDESSNLVRRGTDAKLQHGERFSPWSVGGPAVSSDEDDGKNITIEKALKNATATTNAASVVDSVAGSSSRSELVRGLNRRQKREVIVDTCIRQIYEDMQVGWSSDDDLAAPQEKLLSVALMRRFVNVTSGEFRFSLVRDFAERQVAAGRVVCQSRLPIRPAFFPEMSFFLSTTDGSLVVKNDGDEGKMGPPNWLDQTQRFFEHAFDLDGDKLVAVYEPGLQCPSLAAPGLPPPEEDPSTPERVLPGPLLGPAAARFDLFQCLLHQSDWFSRASVNTVSIQEQHDQQSFSALELEQQLFMMQRRSHPSIDENDLRFLKSHFHDKHHHLGHKIDEFAESVPTIKGVLQKHNLADKVVYILQKLMVGEIYTARNGKNFHHSTLALDLRWRKEKDRNENTENERCRELLLDVVHGIASALGVEDQERVFFGYLYAKLYAKKKGEDPRWHWDEEIKTRHKATDEQGRSFMYNDLPRFFITFKRAFDLQDPELDVEDQGEFLHDFKNGNIVGRGNGGGCSVHNRFRVFIARKAFPALVWKNAELLVEKVKKAAHAHQQEIEKQHAAEQAEHDRVLQRARDHQHKKEQQERLPRHSAAPKAAPQPAFITTLKGVEHEAFFFWSLDGAEVNRLGDSGWDDGGKRDEYKRLAYGVLREFLYAIHILVVHARSFDSTTSSRFSFSSDRSVMPHIESRVNEEKNTPVYNARLYYECSHKYYFDHVHNLRYDYDVEERTKLEACYRNRPFEHLLHQLDDKNTKSKREHNWGVIFSHDAFEKMTDEQSEMADAQLDHYFLMLTESAEALGMATDEGEGDVDHYWKPLRSLWSKTKKFFFHRRKGIMKIMREELQATAEAQQQEEKARGLVDERTWSAHLAHRTKSLNQITF
ncbi:unnamed protein product [Amoebophrya sp. A120]|nr:unnamed protein product [Amoebophrya sp. A120]|eukprot:GSA120T00017810001.1